MTRLAPAAVLLLLLSPAGPAAQRLPVVAAVRAAVAQQDFAGGEKIVSAYRSVNGVTPEMIEALSWLGRGALAAKRFGAAERYARQTYELAGTELKARPLDQEPSLPTALGASIEVLAHVMTEEGARTEAIGFLRREFDRHRGTSIEKRIQKNMHLLSLEGKVAPRIDAPEYLGAKPVGVDRLRGKPVLLFFWAHWCSDCKAQAPILARLAAKYKDRGLTIVAPTQRFGYVAAGKPAGPEEEARYIEQVRQASYPVLAGVPVPLSAANHARYGVSSTPTIVLLDRQGIVRLYHPGQMPEPQLDAAIGRVVGVGTTAPPRGAR